MKKYILALLCFLVPISLANAADNDIPYEDNDNSYVVIPNYSFSEDDADTEFRVSKKVDLKEFAIAECKDVPIYFDRCIPAICLDKKEFGKVYRKIKGPSADGGCDYVERTPGYGGVDCSFPASKLEKINNAFHTQFFGLNPSDSMLSTAELDEFKSDMATHCKIVKDSALTSAVTINTDQSNIIDPEFKEASNRTSVQPTIEPKVEIKEVIDNVEKKEDVVQKVSEPKVSEPVVAPVASTKEEEKANTITSLMFTPEEIAQINSVLNNFSLGTGVERIIDTPIDPTKESRNFYLDSIIYYNDDKWTVWVNGKKISNQSTDTALVVKDVAKNYVVLEWSTPSLDKIVPDWRSRVTSVSSNKYISAKKDIEIYLPDETSAVVSFRLSPNQTFEVTNMKIKEGDLG
jgi:hypothetical protein